MILDAGPGHRFDLTFRTLVVAPVVWTGDLSGPGAPDLVLVPATADHADVAVDRPVITEVAHPRDAVGAGPVVVRVRGIAGSSAAEVDRRVRDIAGAARAAGLDASSTVIDLGVDDATTVPDAQALLSVTGTVVALGHPVSVAIDTALGSAVAVAVSAIMAGARLLRLGPDGTDVRTARRAADLTEALLVERAGAA